VLKDALSPASKRRTKVEMPPGELAELTDEVHNFHDQFRNVFQPKYRAWRSLKPPPRKEVRTKMEVYLELLVDGFLECCPVARADRLAARDALVAELESSGMSALPS
jgi:hypothetical protein